MAEKLTRTGIKRDKDMLYWVGADGVYGKRRKIPGQPAGKKVKVADHSEKLDYTKYIYFVDKDGDVARSARQVGGSKRKKPAAKPAAKKAAAKKPAAKKPAAKKPAAKKPAAKKPAAKKPVKKAKR